MLFYCPNEYVRASHEQNDIYIQAYNAAVNKTNSHFIKETEVEKFKEFMREKRPSITIDIIYGNEKV
jgi:hypothetical protein